MIILAKAGRGIKYFQCKHWKVVGLFIYYTGRLWDCLLPPQVLTSNQMFMVIFMMNKIKSFFKWRQEAEKSVSTVPSSVILLAQGPRRLACPLASHYILSMRCYIQPLYTKQWVDPAHTFVNSSFINSPQLCLFNEPPVFYRRSLVICF